MLAPERAEDTPKNRFSEWAWIYTKLPWCQQGPTMPYWRPRDGTQDAAKTASCHVWEFKRLDRVGCRSSVLKIDRATAASSIVVRRSQNAHRGGYEVH